MSTAASEEAGRGVFGSSDRERLPRWSALTAALVETLTDDTTGSAGLRLLDVLGRHLEFDVTALWDVGAGGRLRRGEAWSNPDTDPHGRLRDARVGLAAVRVSLPYAVLRSGQPLWVADLAGDERFTEGPAAQAGLSSAVVFPVRRGGVTVGVIELLSVARREPDLELVDLMRAVSWPAGAVLAALEQSTERDRLLLEVIDVRRRQEFLLRASRVVGEESDYAAALQCLAEVAVPVLGDLCLIDVLDEQQRLVRMVAHHADSARALLADALRENFTPDLAGLHPSVDVLRTRRSRWSAEMSDEFLRATTRDEQHYRIVKELDFRSYIAVPLIAPDRSVLGSLTLVCTASDRRFEEADVTWAEQLAGQVSSVLDRAHSYEHERNLAHTFQRSLLPAALPDIPGLALAAQYLPATAEADVGGDWYDVIGDGGSACLIIGDIEGHDMQAAAVMAGLRHVLLAYFAEDPDPCSALTRLNRFAVQHPSARLATVLAVSVTPATGELVIASAGHLPPVLRQPENTEPIAIQPAPPIGMDWTELTETRLTAPSGDLVLYTDGLVERRHRSLDEGLAQLATAVRKAPGEATSITEYLVSELLDGGGEDDIALLTASWRSV